MGKGQSKLMRKLSPTSKMLQHTASNDYCMCWTKIVGIFGALWVRCSLHVCNGNGATVCAALLARHALSLYCNHEFVMSLFHGCLKFCF